MDKRPDDDPLPEDDDAVPAPAPEPGPEHDAPDDEPPSV